MGKFFYRFILLLLITIVSFIIYLSNFGINTDKFDDLIKNKETCFNMLKARLYRHEIQKKEEESENLAKSKTDIGWGYQIRSYVLQPYQLVKDLRNNLENTDPDRVLDGDIDVFLEAALYKTKVNK